MQIIPVLSGDDLTAIQDLFREYFAWVLDEHAIDLGYQGTTQELASLPGVYALPGGTLLLARVDGQAAGCIALKPLGPDIGELKRMYVRPAYRGRGLGLLLGERLIGEARQRGYHLLRLDSADTMASAHRLYRKLGFQPASPYYQASPDIMARALFMELTL
jgi:GNAT superfamily N-acetyltransferase